MRRARTPALFLLSACLAAVPAAARAAAGDCVTSNVNHGNTSGSKSYRINEGNSADYPGTLISGRRRAVIAAADMWNDSGNAGTFRYTASTTATDIPSALADCTAAGVNYSLVVFDNQNGVRAETEGRCISGGVATQFIIKVHAKDSSGTNWGWSTGAIGAATEFDLIQTIAHEFGHTQRLGHPGSGEAAVMQPTNASQGLTRQRDIYQWDHKCHAEISGYRTLTGYRRNQTGAGAFINPEVSYTGTLRATKGTPSYNASTGQYHTIINESSCYFFTDGLYGTGRCITPIDRRSGIGPRAASWREDSTMDRTFYANWLDTPTAYSFSSAHRVQYVRSDNEYVTQISGSLSRCTSMTGFMTCSATQAVNAGRMLSVGWDALISRSVTAWAQQTRLDDAADRQINVAVGNVSHTTLPQPDGLGVRSLVAPAVACNGTSASGYHCMVAYVDPTDDEHYVRIRRFTPVASATRYPLSVHGTTTTLSVRSSSALAAWYTTDKFWLAIRPAEANQETIIYRSPNTVTWTKEGTTWGYSAVGPSVIAHRTGENIVVTFK